MTNLPTFFTTHGIHQLPQCRLRHIGSRRQFTDSELRDKEISCCVAGGVYPPPISL